MDDVFASFGYCLNYLREQMIEITEIDMVAQPHGINNHPAWLVGHLTYSCQALGGEIGLPAWLPDAWAGLYGTGSVPTQVRTDYESKSSLLEALGDAQVRITKAVANLTPAELDQPLPDETFRALLPTRRHAITQVLVAHTANHLGQLAIWRRLMGYRALSRPFL